MNEPNRFSGKVKVTKADPPATGEPLAKSRDPDYIKVNYYFPKILNRKIKQAAAVSDRELSEIAQQAIEEFLTKYYPSS